MLALTRTERTPRATFGQLRLNGVVIAAVTLEDPDREGKGPIPAGRYRVQLTYSRRFRQLLPELFGVPGFTAIRIHAGNTKQDTTGCILVGRYQSGEGEIAESQLALGELLTRWAEWHDTLLEVTNA